MRVSSEAVATSWLWVSDSDLIGEELLGGNQGERGQGWVSDVGFAVASDRDGGGTCGDKSERTDRARPGVLMEGPWCEGPREWDIVPGVS